MGHVLLFFAPFFSQTIVESKYCRIFAPQLRNQACPDGGIGRRAGLKHQWIHFHPGSTPGLGTEAEKVEKLSPFFFSTPRNSLVIPKFGHDGFVRVIDERIVTEMISCYPNVTDPECACCWKFTLR